MNKNIWSAICSVVLITLIISCTTVNSTSNSNEDTIDLKTLIDHNQLNVITSDMKNVQLSLPNMPIPMTTAMKVNGHGPVSIKSIDGKSFKVLDCRITMSKEAVTKENKVIQEYITYYKLKNKEMSAINKLANKGEIYIDNFFKKITPNAMYQIEDGNSNEPNINDFSILRSKEVYNFLIQDIEGNVFPIQLYIEIDTDVKDLK